MVCPDCGATWAEAGQTCETAFHQFLYWENENPQVGGLAHALMVLCYHLQHPAILSQSWLAGAGPLLRGFVEEGIRTEDQRRRMASAVVSGRRTFKIKATTDDHGRYAHPIVWHMTAADVLASGADAYAESVHAWAAAILTDLRASGNLGESI
jgi:hypothetical protein